MQTRTLGTTEWQLPTIGLGCMGLSEFYGPSMESSAAIKLLQEAVDLGIQHFDTAEMYGIGAANEMLLGEAFADRRDRVFIATKFGPTRDFETGEFTGLDGSPENCRRAIAGSLQRLRTDHIDLRGEHILALMGSTKLEHIRANLGAYDVELSPTERMSLDALAARVIGDRYDEWGMAGING